MQFTKQLWDNRESRLSTECKVFARLEAVPLPGVVLEQCCRSDLAHSDA
jgi:hypothetical protein